MPTEWLAPSHPTQGSTSQESSPLPLPSSGIDPERCTCPFSFQGLVKSQNCAYFSSKQPQLGAPPLASSQLPATGHGLRPTLPESRRRGSQGRVWPMSRWLMTAWYRADPWRLIIPRFLSGRTLNPQFRLWLDARRTHLGLFFMCLSRAGFLLYRGGGCGHHSWVFTHASTQISPNHKPHSSEAVTEPQGGR